MGSIIIGKIIFYYVVDLASKGLQYFQGKSNYKKSIKNILDSMDNKNFIQTISDMIDSKRGIDSGTADSIIKTSYVQNLINKEIKSSSDSLDKTELENELKTVIIKSWNGLANKAVEKVKNDLK